MLTLILGRGSREKTQWTLEQMCAGGEVRPQILLVPETRSHEMQRLLCKVGGGSSSLWGEVLSFGDLARRLFQQTGGLGIPELDEGGRLLLMYRAVNQLRDQLTVYRRPSRKAPFLQALLHTVDELKSSRVEPEALLRAGEGLAGQEGEKLRDLGLIYGGYQALVAQTALDPRDRLTRAEEKLADYPWGEGKDIWVDGFVDFTPQQRMILERLIRQAHRVTVNLTCDGLNWDKKDLDVFAPARFTASKLHGWAKQERIICNVEYLDRNEDERDIPLNHLERQLFGEQELPAVPAQDRVELFRGNTMRGEVEWAAARIRALAREEGLRYRDISVCARNFEDYRHLIQTVFPAYEVPVFTSAMTDILEKPVLTLVTAALDCLTTGYSYDSIFRYLKTDLTDLPVEARDLLENYALKWDLRGRRWTQSASWSWHPKGYGYRWEEEDRQTLERLDQWRRQVVAPLEKLRKSGQKTGRGQAIALYDFLEEIDLPGRLSARVETLRERGEGNLADEYRQLWGILCTGLEQCARLLEDVPMELEEFAPLLRLVLSQYDVGSIPVSLDRVTAGETSRQTGHPARVLILLGADDSAIPGAATAPGLLNDTDRENLSACGIELGKTGQELLCREMTTVYLLCALPTEKLIVTWPGTGPGGEERRPCFLGQRLMRIFSDLEVIREEELKNDFRLEAPIPALEVAGRSTAARRLLSRVPGCGEQVKRLERAASWERGSLSREGVDRLYGKRIPMSASRMDQYKSCHFSYFMQYGLKAEPRRRAGFSAPEYGTFVHYVLEHVLKDPMFTFSGSWSGALSEEEKDYLGRLTRDTVEKYVKEELGDLEDQTERFRYLFNRLHRAVYAVVENVANELRCSKFKPISFELGFGRREDSDLPPVELTVDGITISVSGFVDRVDGWEKDGRLYLRVVDYKTGRKSFDLTEAFNGLGLQMLLYLFTLRDRGEEYYHLPVDSVGVLYMPARDAVIRGSRTMSQEQLQKEMDKELVRSGLVLDDGEILNAMEDRGEEGFRFLPLKVSKTTGKISGDALASAEQFGRLGRHIQKVLEEICRELARGDISADPFWRGPDKNACRYCEYAAACQFEEGKGGDCRRWLPTVSTAQFWKELETGEGIVPQDDDM